MSEQSPWWEPLVGRLILALGRRANSATLSRWIVDLAEERALASSPEQGLCFLFGLEAELYPVAGRLSVAYGGGVHTKHRHTGYHDFFLQRIHPGQRVLDLGCGQGLLAHEAAVTCQARVVGVDLSEKNIALARERFGDEPVTFLVGDALTLDLPGPFDLVILSNILEHLPDRPQLLARLRRQWGPCRFLVRVPAFDRDWRVPLKRELGVAWRLDPTHETEYTLEELVTELEEGGMRLVEHQIRWGEIWAVAE